jgi:hypothetical protein
MESGSGSGPWVHQDYDCDCASEGLDTEHEKSTASRCTKYSVIEEIRNSVIVPNISLEKE